MQTLAGKIAIVAGASRGAGRGVALALGEAGATVYAVGRTSREGPRPSDGAPGTVEDTAEAVNSRGGVGMPVRADLSKEEQVSALFRRVEEQHGKLDVLVNAAWGANFMPFWSERFWDLPTSLWRDTHETISVAWLTSVYAARLMSKRRSGLIAHITDNHHPDPSTYRGQVLHDVGHESLNRLIFGMQADAKKAGITVVGLNPGFMRTERVLMYMTSEEIKKQFRFDLSESPEYVGRAAAALAADPMVLQKSGQLLWAADLAVEYGFTDIDGRKIPRFDPHAPTQPMPE